MNAANGRWGRWSHLRRRSSPPGGPTPVAFGTHHRRNFVGGSVLVIGDSHTVLGGGGAQFPTWDTDCEAGRDTARAVEVVAANLATQHRVVVFDIATNDNETPPHEHWNSLCRLRAVVGSRHVVPVTSWRLDQSLQHVVDNQRRFAAEDPDRTTVADWADFAAHHPELFTADRVHFTSAGVLVRNGIVWTTVRTAERFGG